MKRIILYSIIFACLPFTVGWAIAVQPATDITMAARTIYNDGNTAEPDSVRIQVFLAGVEKTDTWYNSGDAECAAVDGWLIFHDQLQDIDDAGGEGHYMIQARAYDKDSTLYTPWIYNFEVGLKDSAYAILDTTQLWDTRIDSMEAALADASIGDKVWTDEGTRTITGDSYTPDVNIIEISGDSEAADSLEEACDGYDNAGLTIFEKVAETEADADAIRDTAQYLVTATGTSTLTEDSNIGIDLDDVTGTLDAGEIGADAITAAKIAPAVWTELLDSLFDKRQVSDTTTGTYLAELLNALDKVRDSVQYLITATGFSTHSSADAADAVWEEDTTGHYDVGYYGYEATGGGSCPTVSQIADGVWDEDTTGHYNVGTYGYEATGGGAGSPWSSAQRDSILNALIDSHIGDKVWTDGSFTVRAYITEARDSLRAQDDWIANATELGKVLDSLGKIIDSLEAQDDWIAGATDLSKALDSLGKLLDSAYSYDGWIATATNMGKALDSLGKLLDSAYAYDGWIAHQTTVDSLYDSLLIVLDSLEALEAWVSKLTTSDNIGINLNDVSGTLDVGEIAAAVYEEFWRNIDTTNVDTSLIGEWLTKAIWNAATRTLSALGFSLDATDYSGVSNLWNEGKAGYSLTASQWEEVWRNIDTTNIDTSEIGEWFTTGISASISDANMGAIGDSVWLKDTTGLYDAGTYGYEATTSAGCNCGDGAYTRYIVLLDSSNSDAPVPDASVFLNNLDQTLSDPYYNFTDANGTAIFQIDAGDSLVILTNATGFQSTQDSMDAPAAISYDTVYTYSPADNKTLVWGVLQKADGTAYASAEVRIDLIAYPVDSTLTFNDTIIVQTIAYDTANSDGKWQIYLFSNDNLSDSSFYQFYFRDQYGDKILRESGWLTHLPDTSSIKFNDCTRWR